MKHGKEAIMDKLDRLNQKLKNRERIFGYTVYMPDTYVIDEYMPEGVDYILFDCEHGPYNDDYYAPFFRLCRSKQIPTIVRVQDASYALVSHAMDIGADGILLPRVETLEQVKNAVEGMYLPPDGKKGYGGKFQFYPGEKIAEYRRRRVLWIQIESPEGVKLLPKIIRQYGDYISACVIGPFDMSVNIGTPLDVWSEAETDAIRDVFTQCETAGISSGIYVGDEEAAAKRIELGANLLWMSCDAIYMTRAIARAARDVAAL